MATQIVSAFELLGVRIRYTTLRKPRVRGNHWQKKDEEERWRRQPPARINVLRDDRGEYFEVLRRLDASIEVCDLVLHERHLLLGVQPTQAGESTRSTFLCGHDERAWFAAAIPEDADARTVHQAKDALKPPEVWEAMKHFNVPRSERNLRATAAFIRQGEWFFIPYYDMEVKWDQVVFNEPIRRGRGKPHLCQSMFRRDGELVYASDEYPNGLTFQELSNLTAAERDRHKWERRMRGAEVFVRGTVQHADHETINLPVWHKVVMNTETRSLAMQQLAFLD